jgi:hypothetical protein
MFGMFGKLEVVIDHSSAPGFGRFMSREMRINVYHYFVLNNLITEVDQVVEKTLALLVDLYAQGLNRLPSNNRPQEFEGVQALCTLLSSWAPSFRKSRPVLFSTCKYVLEFVRDMNLADQHFGYHPWVKTDINVTIIDHF